MESMKISVVLLLLLYNMYYKSGTKSMKKRRAVITGLGVIAPNGIGKVTFWKALKEGKSGIRKITRFDVSSYSSQIA